MRYFGGDARQHFCPHHHQRKAAPASDDVMEAAAEYTGELNHAWTELQALASQTGESPRLAQAMETVK